jgi:hypothetical protein
MKETLIRRLDIPRYRGHLYIFEQAGSGLIACFVVTVHDQIGLECVEEAFQSSEIVNNNLNSGGLGRRFCCAEGPFIRR